MYSFNRAVQKLVLGVDPALNNTGWGVVSCKNNTFDYIASGTIINAMESDTPTKLKIIHDAILKNIANYKPLECAVEETFVNRNPYLSLKLGYAKGIILLVAAEVNLPVFEYAPSLIKKALTNNGKASKERVASMVRCLLPRHKAQSDHETDALAIAICHINTLKI